jgi:hypothetical protein
MPDWFDVIDAQPGAVSGTIAAALTPAVCSFQSAIASLPPRSAGIEQFPGIPGYRRLGLPLGQRG